MNKQALEERLVLLANDRKQTLVKHEEGRNVIISGQQIVDQANKMLDIISGAEQDCHYWLKELDKQERKEAAGKEAAAASITKSASFEEADAYKVDDEPAAETENAS